MISRLLNVTAQATEAIPEGIVERAAEGDSNLALFGVLLLVGMLGCIGFIVWWTKHQLGKQQQQPEPEKKKDRKHTDRVDLKKGPNTLVMEHKQRLAVDEMHLLVQAIYKWLAPADSVTGAEWQTSIRRLIDKEEQEDAE